MGLSGQSDHEYKARATLKSENEHLRDLVVSLSATVLRQTAFEFCGGSHASRADPKHLLSVAEECFRCARVPGLRKETVEGLEVAGNEFMARAVEIETTLQRDKWKNGV